MEDNADSELYSNELKKQAGFGKDGEKGFLRIKPIVFVRLYSRPVSIRHYQLIQYYQPGK